MRENLFRSALDTNLTVVFTPLLAWVAYRVAKFVFVDARWAVVERNITNLMVGGFPRDRSGASGPPSSCSPRRSGSAPAQSASSAAGRSPRAVRARSAKVACAASARSSSSSASSSGSRAPRGAPARPRDLGGRSLLNVVGRRTPQRLEALRPPARPGRRRGRVPRRREAFGGVGWSLWGGFLLTVFLAVAAILLSFPFGVLLALGPALEPPRRARVCVAYIELFRGVPLITILFMAFFMIGFFLPRGVGAEPRHARDIGFTLFTCRLRRGDRARRPAVGARRPDRGRPGARALAAPHDVPHRAPPGAAGRDPRPRRPVHQPLQGHVARLHPRADGAARRRPEHHEAAGLPRAGPVSWRRSSSRASSTGRGHTGCHARASGWSGGLEWGSDEQPRTARP